MQISSAPVWKRLLAFIYDGLVVTALILISGLVSSLVAQGEAPPWLTQLLLVFSVGGYFWWSWHKGGQTAGMRAWRLRLVSCNGEPPTPWSALKRLIVCVLTLAPTGITLLTAWLSPTKQTIYDFLSQTRVIVELKSEASKKIRSIE